VSWSDDAGGAHGGRAAGGLLAGVYEGLHLQVRFLGRQTFARRTVVGVGAWGAGVMLVQAAGVIGRVGLADFGLAVSFFGIGQVVGLLTGRWQSVLDAQRARAGRLAGAALVVLAVSAALLPGGGPSAQAAEASRQTEDLSTGDVQVTLQWSSLADLDLSVTDPAGETVSYTHPPPPPGANSTATPITRAAPPPPTRSRTCSGRGRGPPRRLPIRGDLPHRLRHRARPELRADHPLRRGGGPPGRGHHRARRGGHHRPGVRGARAALGGGEVGATAPVAAVDDDPDNRLWDCASNPGHRAGFGDTAEDMARCFTFRYAIPAGGIQSAVVYMSIEAPTGSLQDTDSVAVAVGEGFPTNAR